MSYGYVFGSGGSAGSKLSEALMTIAEKEYSDSLMGAWWWEASRKEQFGETLSLLVGASFAPYKGIKTSDELFANPAALDAFMSSQTARQTAFYSLYCATDIAGNSNAFNALIADVNRLTDYIQSTTARYEMLEYEDNITAMVASTAAMKVIADNSDAMQAMIANPNALTAMVNSSVAMQEVANSSVAMQEVANSSVAMKEVANSSVAMKEVANSSVAMQAIAQNALVNSVALDAIIVSGTALHEIAKAPNALKTLAGIPTTTWETAKTSRYTTMQTTLDAATTLFTKTITDRTQTANSLVSADLRGGNITLMRTYMNTYTAAQTYNTGLVPSYTGGYAKAVSAGGGTIANKIYWGGVYYQSTQNSSGNAQYWQFYATTYTSK